MWVFRCSYQSSLEHFSTIPNVLPILEMLSQAYFLRVRHMQSICPKNRQRQRNHQECRLFFCFLSRRSEQRAKRHTKPAVKVTKMIAFWYQINVLDYIHLSLNRTRVWSKYASTMNDTLRPLAYQTSFPSLVFRLCVRIHFSHKWNDRLYSLPKRATRHQPNYYSAKIKHQNQLYNRESSASPAS